MEKFFQDIIDVGGEGIILRNPKLPYQGGRSLGYLKHKVLFIYLFLLFIDVVNSQKFRDAEAKIVRSAGQYHWECELYVQSQSILHQISFLYFHL